MQKKLVFHAEPVMQAHIRTQLHGFANLLSKVFEARGYHTCVSGLSRQNLWQARYDRNFHIFDLDGAIGPRALSMRPAIFQPFWTLERPDSRHQGRMAHKVFAPATVGGDIAKPFFKLMQSQHLGTNLPDVDIKDFALIPLQGHLGKRRYWQYADLPTMVHTIRTHDPARIIVLKPHPKETYGPEDKALIRQLLQASHVQLLDLPIQALIAKCAYIATQNSSAAFEGILHRKPAILFAKADFHHIFPTITSPQDAPAAFARIAAKEFPFMKYLFWYLKMNSINICHATAAGKTLEILYESGWNIARGGQG